MLTRFLHIPTPPGSAQSGVPFSSHRNAPSEHSGVSHGLFYDQATLWLDLQNAHASGSLRSPSVYAPECPFGTFRCSNGRGKLRSPLAPHRTSSSSCSGVPVGLFSEKALQLFLQNARPSAAVRPPMGGGSFAPPCTPLSCPSRIDLSSVQKTPHLFSDGQTGCNSARTLLFPLPG